VFFLEKHGVQVKYISKPRNCRLDFCRFVIRFLSRLRVNFNSFFKNFATADLIIDAVSRSPEVNITQSSAYRM